MDWGKETITREDLLYRRFLHWHIRKDGRLSSSVFMNRKKKPDSELSVDLARLTTPANTQAVCPTMGVAEIAASVPFELGLRVEHSPDLENNNYAHCLIIGLESKSQCRKLAESARILLRPRKLVNDC